LKSPHHEDVVVVQIQKGAQDLVIIIVGITLSLVKNHLGVAETNPLVDKQQ
jgi:hypothetical protein